MKIFQHIRIPAVWAVVAAVLAVSSCEDPREEEAKFLVNRQTQDSTFELAPEGLNLLYDVEKDMERERISIESLEEAKKSNILSADANDIARKALQEARESKFIACIALVVAIIIGILTISG